MVGKRLLRLGGLAAVVSIGGLGAATWASAQSSPAQTIRACVDSEGNIRIIGANDRCKRNEREPTVKVLRIADDAGPTSARRRIERLGHPSSPLPALLALP